jgi:F0F1-type ATP synthase membrane subunit c/vacuolar-type H+-ATPase subunit K
MNANSSAQKKLANWVVLGAAITMGIGSMGTVPAIAAVSVRGQWIQSLKQQPSFSATTPHRLFPVLHTQKQTTNEPLPPAEHPFQLDNQVNVPPLKRPEAIMPNSQPPATLTDSLPPANLPNQPPSVSVPSLPQTPTSAATSQTVELPTETESLGIFPMIEFGQPLPKTTYERLN